MATFEGKLIDTGGRYAVVAGRFNEFVTRRLLEGTLDGFRRHGIDESRVDVCWVPGSFEIPAAAQRLARTGGYRGVVALGCVIRGATAHFDYVAGGVASGIGSVSLDTGVPCVFGVLTTDTIEQAIERAGTKAGNKGFDAALTAIEMASLYSQLDALPHPTEKA